MFSYQKSDNVGNVTSIMMLDIYIFEEGAKLTLAAGLETSLQLYSLLNNNKLINNNVHFNHVKNLN